MTQDTLALLGGQPVQTVKPAPYPQFSDEALAEVSRLLRHERGLLQGLSKHHELIGEFEKRFADYHGVAHCLATSSGHGALQSALVGLEVTGGDHVLTSPYSWGASVSCILHNGAVPVFADVDPLSGLLDPARLGDYLTPETTAILVPHIYGQPADMTAIMEFARKHALRVIEDGSQAHGAVHRGQRVGSFGDAAGFSVNGVKPLATTEGGFMLTTHADAYWRVTISCQHAGRSEMLGRANEPGFPEELRPYIDSLVYTYRPECVSAILALDQLEKLDAVNQCRRDHAKRFLDGIADLAMIEAPRTPEQDEGAYYMMTLNFDAEQAGVSRDVFLAAIQAEGVPAVAYVDKSLHRSPRLSPDWSGPRVMWTETLRRAGLDPTAAELPGCEAKVACAIEIPWTHATPQPDLIDGIVAAFQKVAGQLDALQAHEHAKDARPMATSVRD